MRWIDSYAASLDLPPELAPGNYQLIIQGAQGGRTNHAQLPITVAARKPWPDTRYDVRASGAIGDGQADDTKAFAAALAQAQANGGGVVFIPRGTYKITAKLTIPPNTTLRGEKREHVWLYVPKQVPEFDTVLAGSGNFAVEDLSLVAQTAKRLIVCPDDPSIYTRPRGGNPPMLGAGVHLRRLRLQHVRYAHRMKPDSPLRLEQEGPSTIVLHGPDMEITDCDIVSSGMPVELHQAHHYRIERNHLQTGRQGWYGFWNLDESTFIDNEIEGRDLEASYGGVEGRCDRVYFAGNRFHDAYGDEREALTLDQPYHVVWMDKAARIDGRTLTAAGAKWKPGQLKNNACLIASGQGIGQYLHILDNTEDTLTVERDWTIAPDSTSVFAVRASKSQVVITRNTFADASVAVQLYANCWNFIVDGNKAERTGGIYGIGGDEFNTQRKLRRFSTCSFCQFLNNDLSQGFVYQQGAFMYGVLGPCIPNQAIEPLGVPVIGNIVRNNTVRDNFTVGALGFRPHPFLPPKSILGYVGRDTIIEDNIIADGTVALAVYPGYLDTVLRNNTVERCSVPLQDDGTNTWIHPAERLRYAIQAARSLPQMADRLDEIQKAAADLTTAPVNAEATVQQAASLRQQLWAALAASSSDKTPLPGHILSAVIGWHYELDPTSSIRKVIAAQRGGEGEARLRFRTEPWSPEVSAMVNVVVPEGWAMPAPSATMTLRPADAAQIAVPLRLPPATALPRLRMRWTVTLAGVPLVAEDCVEVAALPPATRPATLPSTSSSQPSR